MPYSVEFTVLVATRPAEAVFVVGDLPQLGEWDPVNAVPLFPDANEPGRWTTMVSVSAQTLRYRYFIAYFLDSSKDSSTSRSMIIAHWESFLHPRSLLVHVEALNGVRKSTKPDTFGCYGGRELTSYGWLMTPQHNEILIRMHGNALKFFAKRDAERVYRVKVTPFDLRLREVNGGDEDGEDSEDLPLLPSFSMTELAVLSSDQWRFHEQNPTGECFVNDRDYFVFRTQSVAVEFLAFRVEFFLDSADLQSHAKSASIAIVMPSSMSDTFGKAAVPILNHAQQPVGQLFVDYLFVRGATTNTAQHSMQLSYGRHWKRRHTLEVGHRGAGNSYTKLAAVRENTIYSLNYAARNGADFVEFDVHLTKDRIPIVFHDFHVLVSVARRPGSGLSVNGERSTSSEEDFHELAVKDLKLRQLHLLHLSHHKAGDTLSSCSEPVKQWQVTGTADEDLEHRPFPTLVDALRDVLADVGFNIEVKYPMMQKNDEHECEHYFERNLFVDRILEDVFEHAGSRRILFSSFDPDVCTMIALKQNRYPVLFLCVGATTRYVPFLDVRCGTSQMAVHFAASSQLLGVNFHSEDLLRDASPVQQAAALGMVSFVWGDDLDTRENIDYFKKQLRVNGIIYDRIGEVDTRENVFIVEREAKGALFQPNSRSTSPNQSQKISTSSRKNSLDSSSLNRSSNTNGHAPAFCVARNPNV